MAIKKESLKALLTRLKIGTPEEITALVDSAEEKDVTLPDSVKLFTPEEYAQLETNLKDSGKGVYTKVGKEMAVKELKEKLKLEYEGKDLDTFLEKAKDHFVAEAKVPANEARQQWETDKKTLQQQIADLNTKIKEEATARKAVEQDATLLKKFPADRNNTLSDEDRLLLLKSKVQIKEEDGKEVVYYKGTKLQDQLTNPLPLDKALADVFKSENWTGGADQPPKGGRGGSNSIINAKPASTSEAAKEWKKNNPDKGFGAEFQAHIVQLKKENADFKLDGINTDN
jgi:hypothetical protein